LSLLTRLDDDEIVVASRADAGMHAVLCDLRVSKPRHRIVHDAGAAISASFGVIDGVTADCVGSAIATCATTRFVEV
jgi:hypothetical protein